MSRIGKLPISIVDGVEVTIAEGNYVTVKVILDDGYVFADGFVFTYNGSVIDSAKYTIEGNTLTYVYEDTNWGPIA